MTPEHVAVTLMASAGLSTARFTEEPIAAALAPGGAP
jgi:hypothetical protein